MRTIGIAVVLLTLLLALSSCTIKLGNSADDKPAATKTSSVPSSSSPSSSSTATPNEPAGPWTTTPTTTTTRTPTAPAAPAHIKVLSLKAGDKRDPKTGEITHMTAVFTTRTPTIFVTAKLKGLEKGDDITAQLIGVNISGADGAKARDKQLVKTAIESTGDTATAGYHFTPPKAGWPTGLYKTDILVNGQYVRSFDTPIPYPRRCLSRNANVPTPLISCGPLKYSISVRSPIPNRS